MNKGIEAKEILVKDLLDHKFLFNIPIYQRPFTWEKDNIDQLFEDIKQSLENEERNYFLGSIILETKKEEKDGSGIYDLVDGQQRIATLIILLAVMRDLASQVDKLKNAADEIQPLIYQRAKIFLKIQEKPKLTVWEEEEEFFKEYILEPGSTLKNIDIKSFKSDARRNMVTAIQLFKDKLNDDQGKLNEELLGKMIDYLLNSCILVYVKTGSLTSAFRLFSVLNTRGLSLTTADLLKSDNLSVVDDSEKERYGLMWRSLEDELGRDELEKVISFIRTIFVKEKAKKTLFEEYQEKIFQKNKISKGKKFIEYLKKITDIYEEKVLNAEIASNSDVGVKYHNLMSLMRDFIPSSDWIPPFIRFCERFTDVEETYKFLLQLERSFVVDWINGLTPTQRLINIYKILALIEKATHADEAINNNIFNNQPRKSEFMTVIDTAYFYNKPYSKYVLLRIDLNLSENVNIKKRYTGTITVEHILPRNPPKNSEWTRLFIEENRERWTDKIGNLVLLSRRKNSSANNKPFGEKKIKYYERGITDFELTKEIKNYSEWNLESLEKRHKMLLERVEKLWVD